MQVTFLFYYDLNIFTLVSFESLYVYIYSFYIFRIFLSIKSYIFVFPSTTRFLSISSENCGTSARHYINVLIIIFLLMKPFTRLHWINIWCADSQRVQLSPKWSRESVLTGFSSGYVSRTESLGRRSHWTGSRTKPFQIIRLYVPKYRFGEIKIKAH